MRCAIDQVIESDIGDRILLSDAELFARTGLVFCDFEITFVLNGLSQQACFQAEAGQYAIKALGDRPLAANTEHHAGKRLSSRFTLGQQRETSCHFSTECD